VTTRQLRAEVERLQAEVARLQADTDVLWKSVADKNAEILRLRAAIKDSAPQHPSAGGIEV
jgi:peptidoglycan hydrolase CwlO-like protein